MPCIKALAFAGVAFASLLLTGSALAESKEKVLHRFNYTNGFKPLAPVIFDNAGNLYGTTYDGGTACQLPGCGIVFKLSPTAKGDWKETVIHSFPSASGDGWNPYGGVVLDRAGNLYGATSSGGKFDGGTVFKLTPNSNGSWTETILHSFGGRRDGSEPSNGQLLIDASGNIYGTTASGGHQSCAGSGCGIVFRLSPSSGGKWTEEILYRFRNSRTDGWWPWFGLVADPSGNLFGVTAYGGIKSAHCSRWGCGTIFELSPSPSGVWKETMLHFFKGAKGHDGSLPDSPLTMDTAGNLYGVTGLGGRLDCGPVEGCGTVFELVPNGDGTWTENVLRAFHDYRYPVGGVVLDRHGNLYGTTSAGGPASQCNKPPYGGCGTLFELSPTPGGKWMQTTLHTFGVADGDGFYPNGGLVFDTSGNLYGTSYAGGIDTGECADDGAPTSCGTVFEFTP